MYVDAVDANNHAAAPAGLNTYNLDDSPWQTTTSDATSQWRFRNTGPGAVSYGTSSYQGRYTEGDAPMYTKVTGLTPVGSYGGLRLYFDLVGHGYQGQRWGGDVAAQHHRRVGHTRLAPAHLGRHALLSPDRRIADRQRER